MVILKILIYKFGNEEKILKEIHSFVEKIKIYFKKFKIYLSNNENKTKGKTIIKGILCLNSIISHFNDSELNEENKDLINIELLLLNILNKYKNHHRCSKDHFQIIYNYLFLEK